MLNSPPDMVSYVLQSVYSPSCPRGLSIVCMGKEEEELHVVVLSYFMISFVDCCLL